jgi:hypothetical protein
MNTFISGQLKLRQQQKKKGRIHEYIVSISTNIYGFQLIQITWLNVLARIVVIFRPVHYTKNKNYNRNFTFMVRLRFQSLALNTSKLCVGFKVFAVCNVRVITES